MARFFGNIGFVFGATETRPGVWEELKSVRGYYGDVMKRRTSWEKGESINDNLQINNQISILADEYAEANAYAMKWVEWKGIKWKVTSIEFERPRMILTLGSVYNEVTVQEEETEHDP